MAPSANTPPSASPRPYDGLDRLFIAGAWRDGASGETAQDVNPYNQEVLSAHVLANRADVDEAYAAAERAQREWAAAAPAERAAVLRRAVELFDARHDELVGWVQRESGSIRAKAEFEVGAARNITEEAASFPYRMHGEIFPSDTPHKENRVYRQPLGVVGVISPWNFPMNLSNRSVATALACGNAVVFEARQRHARHGRPAAGEDLRGGRAAGGPAVGADGTRKRDRRLLRGAPRAEAHLVHRLDRRGARHRREDGRRHAPQARGAGAGRQLPARRAGRRGRGPAVDIAIIGRFLHQGQICMSTNRIIVDASLVDEFTERFVDRARNLVCGDPFDPATDIGPIINQSQLAGLMRKVQRAKDQGALVLLDGEPEGLVMPPVVFGVSIPPGTSRCRKASARWRPSSWRTARTRRSGSPT